MARPATSEAYRSTLEKTLTTPVVSNRMLRVRVGLMQIVDPCALTRHLCETCSVILNRAWR